VGARFSAPIQTSPEAHPASYTMGTGSFLGVKRPGHGADHPPPSSAEVKERVELYLFPPLGLCSLFQGEHYLYLYIINNRNESDGQSFITRTIFKTLQSNPVSCQQFKLTTNNNVIHHSL